MKHFLYLFILLILGWNGERGYRDYKRDGNRREKEYKRDRDSQYQHSSHHNRYNDGQHDSRNHQDDNSSIGYNNRYDNRRYSPGHHRSSSSSSHYGNHKFHESSVSSESSFGGSPYSTPPPPAPPRPPPGPPPGAPPVTPATQYTMLGNTFKEQNIKRTLDPRMSKNQKKKNSEEKKQNFKLLIDPTIKKGHTKIVRYDGILTGVSVISCVYIIMFPISKNCGTKKLCSYTAQHHAEYYIFTLENYKVCRKTLFITLRET